MLKAYKVIASKTKAYIRHYETANFAFVIKRLQTQTESLQSLPGKLAGIIRFLKRWLQTTTWTENSASTELLEGVRMKTLQCFEI